MVKVLDGEVNGQRLALRRVPFLKRQARSCPVLSGAVVLCGLCWGCAGGDGSMSSADGAMLDGDGAMLDGDGAMLDGDGAMSGAAANNGEQAAGTAESATESSESGAQQGENTQEPASSENATQLDGAQLYQSQCGACHGPDGAGSELAPEIQHPYADYFRWVLRNGLTGAFDLPMVAYPQETLSEPEADAILSYLQNLPEATTDEELYLDYCANCHGADARGGPASKTIAGKNEFLEVVRQGKGGSNFGERTRYMPRWSSAELDSELVSRLEQFVGGLPE